MSTDESLDEHRPVRRPLPARPAARRRGPDRPAHRAARGIRASRSSPRSSSRWSRGRAARRDPHHPFERGETRLGQALDPGAGGRRASSRPGHDGHRALDRRPSRSPARGDRPLRPRHRAGGRLGLAGRACRWLGQPAAAADLRGPGAATSTRRAGSIGREKLAAIPLQSASSFLDVEILAKATFFGHLIDEVDVPPLGGRIVRAGWSGRLRNGLSRVPPFLRRGARAQVQRKSRRASRKVTTAQAARIAMAWGDVEPKPGPFEDHPAQGADQLGQGQGLDEGLDGRRGTARTRRRRPRRATSAA